MAREIQGKELGVLGEGVELKKPDVGAGCGAVDKDDGDRRRRKRRRRRGLGWWAFARGGGGRVFFWRRGLWLWFVLPLSVADTRVLNDEPWHGGVCTSCDRGEKRSRRKVVGVKEVGERGSCARLG